MRGLEYLSLVRCRALQSLPDSIGAMHNLQVLSVDDCPQLGTPSFDDVQFTAEIHVGPLD